MPTKPTLTTAQLRTLAWEAYQDGRYSDAARLYGEAIAAYPKNLARGSKFSQIDIAKMEELQCNMLSMSQSRG